MRSPFAGLTTRGKCLLTAGTATAICAVLLNERDLLRIAAFLLMLPLLVLVSSESGRFRVTARRKPPPAPITAGERTEVGLVLWRRGLLPVPRLLLADDTSGIMATRERFVVSRVPRHRGISLHYPIRPEHRGAHRIGPLRATITDPFGLTEVTHPLCGPGELLVLPRVETLHDIPGAVAGNGSGAAGTRRHAGHGAPDVLLRQYRQGDDPRKVHWPSTARHDEIMMRLEEQAAGGTITVLLDRRAVGHSEPELTSGLDWMVSFVASSCLHLSSNGHTVHIVDEGGESLGELTRNARRTDREHLLRTLATVQPTQRRAVNDAGSHGSADRLIAVLGVVDADTARALTRHRTQQQEKLAVLLDDSTVSDIEQAAGILGSAGWWTVTATSRSAVSQTWAQLCTPARSTSAPNGDHR